MNGQKELYDSLSMLKISFDYYGHPAAPTIEEAMKYWANIEATHCKNLFFRNHKGDKHYLVILDHHYALDIHDLEKRLKQGKLSFASEKRMEKHLGIKPGSVSPLALINDKENHVHVFFDETLKNSTKISFHPNINTASIVMQFQDFIKFMDYTGNSYEFQKLYD
jgi:Ala-tRNA(Pro) deacylase